MLGIIQTAPWSHGVGVITGGEIFLLSFHVHTND